MRVSNVSKETHPKAGGKARSYVIAIVLTFAGVGLYWLGREVYKMAEGICSDCKEVRVQCEPESLHSWNTAMSIEGVEVNGETVFRIVGTAGAGEGWIKAASGAYLVDAAGKTYQLERDTGSYRSEGYTDWRKLLPHEVYRFRLVFPKLSYKAPFVYFRHPEYGEMKVNLKWET